MNTVEILNSKDIPKWEDFIKNHELGQFYHTSIWKEILEKSFPHIKANNLLLTQKQDNTIEAALSLYVVKSNLIGNRLVSIPFGTLCDPLVKTKKQFKLLLDRVFELKKQSNCNRIELKIFRSSEIATDERLNLKCTHKHHYLNLTDDFEKIIKTFKRTVRQSVRKAEDSKLEVFNGKTEADLRAFYNLYLKTRKRNFVPSQPYKFFKNLWKVADNNKFLSLLLAKKRDCIIGGGILIKYKDRTTLEFLASDTDFLHLRPNHLLAWVAIKNAKEEGYKIFDFGRTAPEDNGLMRFKKYWGTTIVDLLQASNNDCKKDTYERDSLKWKFISLLAGKSPIPLYRILNNFCYRHLG